MDEPGRRLFLALWPDDRVRKSLGALQKRIGLDCGGRAVPPENLHVTLKFLGAVPQSKMPSVREIARRAPAVLADMSFDRLGFWPRPAVVFAGADDVPAPILGLVDHLEAGFADIGFTRNRGRFRAHCTLFRKARRRPARTFEPFVWPVRGFVLVESALAPAGSRYRVLETWPSGA